MDVKLSCTIQLLLTVQLVLPLLARPGSSSFVFLHVCTSPSPPLALRYGGAGRNSHHVSMYMKSHHDSPCTCPRPRQQFVQYRKEFPRCLQRPRADVFAAILFALRIQFPDDVSKGKGLEPSRGDVFAAILFTLVPCTFTPPTRQRLRGRSRCKRSPSAVLNYFAYGIVAATAFKGSFQVQKVSINGTLQYGVRKRGLLVRLRRLLQFSFPSGVPKGASSQLSLPSGPRHAVLNYFAYGIVVFVVRDIGVYRVALAQSRPLTGSRVKKVSTKCRLRVDHVYSGTLSGTLILVPFSCHKTGTSSTSMERLQTGSLSNNTCQTGTMQFSCIEYSLL